MEFGAPACRAPKHRACCALVCHAACCALHGTHRAVRCAAAPAGCAPCAGISTAAAANVAVAMWRAALQRGMLRRNARRCFDAPRRALRCCVATPRAATRRRNAALPCGAAQHGALRCTGAGSRALYVDHAIDRHHHYFTLLDMFLLSQAHRVVTTMCVARWQYSHEAGQCTHPAGSPLRGLHARTRRSPS
jgi:hypothetical protein